MPTGQANRIMPTLRRVVLARQSASRSDGELLGAFVNERDADAFAELVRRHGPMVLGVCRRVVSEHATADDAFQAVFLVLARRAASVRPREQVGNWLYGVAYRTALKARMVLARRRSREKQVDVMPEPTAPATATAAWSDLQVVIDEELAKLPDKLRLPVVLCDLEGRPQREVAKHLNVPAATLATRLATARRTLAQRLTRRGVVLSGGALAGLLGVHAAASAVPSALASGAARVGEAIATGTSLQSLVSAKAIQLSEGVMRMMMLAKLKAVAVMAVTALTLTTGLGLGLMPAMAGDQPGSFPTPVARPSPAAQAASDSANTTELKNTDNHIAARLKAAGQSTDTVDDATFLRRLCLDLRGTPPTPVEMWFFAADEDQDKRAKVVEWIVEDEEMKTILAKKLGVSPEQIKVVRAKLAADGTVELLLEGHAKQKAPIALAFTPDGRRLAMNVEHKVVAAEVRWLRVATTADARPLAVWLKSDNPQKVIDGSVEMLWAAEPNTPLVADDELYYFWNQVQPNTNGARFHVYIVESDADFLKRVLRDVRGSGPTPLELKYFTEDKDPKKREKLLDALLKDPEVQKKLGAAWKKKMLDHNSVVAPPSGYHRYTVPLPQDQWQFLPTSPQGNLTPNQPVPPAPKVDKFEKLVNELIDAKKSDEAILESLTLATLGRLPTDSEKKLTLASIATAKDRKAAWVAIAKALAGTEESKKVEYKFKAQIIQPSPPAPPVPPTKFRAQIIPPTPPAPPVPPAKP